MKMDEFLDILHEYRARRSEELESMTEEERTTNMREMTKQYAEKYGLKVVKSVRKKTVLG